ncbi:SDR family oxidoreductase [Zavarzinia compransoris]|uniref:Short chain dehydrogenase n=1 Tax=Zavarzinia compransoris TaxID=1264899 RepID=A0A317DYB6_9PROT|nr:SDR family oxidoreductase [Zavarzinia compransoris]PWR19659.1 short chain dehydrogenase [Zavarzinia compransoris]TDP43399.1 short-subunit dehydrogenase [Zavarzinia compransoris]
MAISSASAFRVDSGEVTLAGHVAGPEGKPTIVLIHGYPDDSTVWDGVVADLARDHRVITYDVRGAGLSGAPSSGRGYHLGRLMADLASVLDAEAPTGKVHLVGHDWGSIQGWQALVDPRTRVRIASYTSISGPSLDLAFSAIRQRVKDEKLAALPPLLGQLLKSWYILAFHLPVLAPTLWRAGIARLWPRILKLTDGIETEAHPGQLRDGVNGINLYRANFRERMFGPKTPTIEQPVQLLVPTQDPFVSPAIFDNLSDHVPLLTREDVRTGHWLPLTDPALIADRVRRFVTHVETGADCAALAQGRRRAARHRRGAGPFAGQLALVTGAGSGIGRATALALAAKGADVIATDIDLDAAERTATLARLVGVEASARRLDVADAAAMDAFAQWVDETLGAVDIVVNNAGIGLAGDFLDTSAEDWKRVLDVNLWGVIHGSRLFGQRMVARKMRGHIVNVASAAAFMPARGLSAYATTKSAVLMMSTCLRAELADKGIGVSAICPGLIDTGITDRTTFVGVTAEEQARKRTSASRLYARRALTADSVAADIVKAIEGDRPVAMVGIEAVAGHLLGRLSPALLRRLAGADLMPK